MMKRRAWAAILAALLAGGCAAPPEPAAPPAGRIDGAVVGPLLHPYGNVTVTLEDLGRSTATTPLGGFSFLDVPAGTHLLSVAVEGTSGDRGTVDVEDGGVARIILQVYPFPAATPYVASLRDHGRAPLALPGAECADCAWTTTVPERPDLAVLEAAWRGSPADGRLVVRLWNGPELVAELTVPGDGQTHRAGVGHALLPGAGGRLSVTAHFGDDFVPTVGFSMESRLFLHYHTS